MRLFGFFRPRSASESPSTSTIQTRPRGKIAAPFLAGSRRAEPKAVADLAERMERDYQVNLAQRVLSANLQSVRVSISAATSEPRACALAEDLTRLWEQTLSQMMPAIGYGRVAFEKIYGYEPRSNLMLIKSLEALPYRQSRMVLGEAGGFDGIELNLGSSVARIPADKSWWLALDATLTEPHGKSQYLGAPAQAFSRREKTRKRFDTLMNRLSVRGLIAYHPLDEEDERGNRYDPGEVLGAQLDALTAGGHLLLPNTRNPAGDDYAYRIQETAEVLDTGPMLAAITAEDAEQLRAFGIPEKTVTEGDAVGSHAMVRQQTLVLYAVVDGLLGQFARSFQKYVIDTAVELNFESHERPRIAIRYPRVAERPDSILAQVVTSLLSSPRLNPLIESGAIDLQQLLEAAGIPLAGNVQECLGKATDLQARQTSATSLRGIPGHDAMLQSSWDNSKHPRKSNGEWAKKSEADSSGGQPDGPDKEAHVFRLLRELDDDLAPILGDAFEYQKQKNEVLSKQCLEGARFTYNLRHGLQPDDPKFDQIWEAYQEYRKQNPDAVHVDSAVKNLDRAEAYQKRRKELEEGDFALSDQTAALILDDPEVFEHFSTKWRTDGFRLLEQLQNDGWKVQFAPLGNSKEAKIDATNSIITINTVRKGWIRSREFTPEELSDNLFWNLKEAAHRYPVGKHRGTTLSPGEVGTAGDNSPQGQAFREAIGLKNELLDELRDEGLSSAALMAAAPLAIRASDVSTFIKKAASRTWPRHHPFPKYLGGGKQTLKKMPLNLHKRFHASLDGWMGAKYARVHSAKHFENMDKREIIRDLREFYKNADGGIYRQYLPDFEKAVEESGYGSIGKNAKRAAKRK